jgi:purine nucleosidase
LNPLYVDSDNAIAAPRGDVDDAFALAAVLASGVPVAAIGSVAGNTTEPLAVDSNRETAVVCGYAGSILGGVEAARFLAARSSPLRVLALGPLTNLAAALATAPGCASHWTELVLVGGNRSSWGRWPPFWPFEFNLTKDLPAARSVFACGAPLVVVPLDVAKRLRVGAVELNALGGGAGRFLCCGSQRWLKRARRTKLTRTFPVWDLVAAMYVVEPRLFEVRKASASLRETGRIAWGEGRRVRIVSGFDPTKVWEAFARALF